MARSDAGQAARAQQGASPPAWLYQPSTGQHTVLPMDRPKLTIGRDASNDLSLDDPDVSRWHAVLLRTGSEWLIEDTASTNGTYVNGLRITSPTTLNNGDTLRVGNGLFSFGSQQPNPPKPPNPPKQSKSLRNAIIAALVLFVIGLLANSLNTYFERLQNTWLTGLLPNMVSAVVVVIGVLVNHFSSSGNQPSDDELPRPQSPKDDSRRRSSRDPAGTGHRRRGCRLRGSLRSWLRHRPGARTGSPVRRPSARLCRRREKRLCAESTRRTTSPGSS